MENGRSTIDKIIDSIVKLVGLGIVVYLLYADIHMQKEVELSYYVIPAILMQVKISGSVIEALSKVFK